MEQEQRIQTLNAEHGTRNTELETRNTKRITRNTEHGTRNSERGSKYEKNLYSGFNGSVCPVAFLPKNSHIT